MRDGICLSTCRPLPIKYFDTHAHGDLMSCYTNDTDTLRQLIIAVRAAAVLLAVTVISVFITMMHHQLWMTLIVLPL